MIITEMPGIVLEGTDATAADIVSGKTAYNGSAEKMTGAMINYGSITQTLNAGSRLILYPGYYESSIITGGTVTPSIAKAVVPGSSSSDKTSISFTTSFKATNFYAFAYRDSESTGTLSSHYSICPRTYGIYSAGVINGAKNGLVGNLTYDSSGVALIRIYSSSYIAYTIEDTKITISSSDDEDGGPIGAWYDRDEDFDDDIEWVCIYW